MVVLSSLLLLLASSSSSSLLQPTFAQETTISSTETKINPPTTHSFSSLRLPHHPSPRSYSTHTYYVVELDPSSSLSPKEAARRLGTQLVERVGELDNHYLVRKELNSLGKRDEGVWERWQEGNKSKRAQGGGTEAGGGLRGAVRGLEEMVPKMRVKRSWEEPEQRIVSRRISGRQDVEDLTEINHLHDAPLEINDPLLPKQWHVVNTLIPDNSMNVSHIWDAGMSGQGVHVALIDDGLDYTHEDLKDNFYPEGSYDFNEHTPLPTPKLFDDTHGTRCAGEISASPNDVCGVGLAYSSRIAGIRILSAPISDADEAAALNYGYQTNDIYSCSWGPPDDGKNMDAPEGLILKAMVNGIQKGRGGKGSLFVFAAGNGGGNDDQCNFDGYTNSIYSITIGALDRKGLHPYYSEMCAALLAVAYSSGSGDAIHTTDRGDNKCSDGHGGTSAAAPLMSGALALALQVRPELTWRDAQHLIVNAVEPFNEGDPDWEPTFAGRKFNYKYGYGKANAGLLVEAAKTWTLVKPQAWYDSSLVRLETPSSTTDGSQGQFISEEGVESIHTVSAAALVDANLERLEHVTVQVWIDHARRGDVEVELTSPNGIKSVLARTRRGDEADTGFPGWKFMSMKHWDEPPVGDWKLKVIDRIHPEKNGTLKAWSLMLWGESIDASKTKLYVLPGSESPIEDEVDDDEPTAEPSATLPLPGTATKSFPKPTVHLPDDHVSAPGESHLPGLGDPKLPIDDADDDAEVTPDVPSSAPISTGLSDEGEFDGIDTLSSGTWIFGAAGFVALAGLSGVGFFFYRRYQARRRGFGNEEGEGGYGAVPGEEDVAMGLLGGSGSKRSRRAGGGAGGGTKELYDAFRSDEEDEEESDGEEAKALGYHDSFLEDDEPPSRPTPGGDYHDDDLDEEEEEGQPIASSSTSTKEREEAEEVVAAAEGGSLGSSGGSGESGSWQEVRK